MAREGLLISQRGRDGGYQLALSPIDISYGDLVRLTRGSLALVPCAARNAHEHCKNCLPESECRLRSLMLRVRDDTASILDRIPLADPIDLAPLFDKEEAAERQRGVEGKSVTVSEGLGGCRGTKQKKHN